jgi:hypothetical protein
VDFELTQFITHPLVIFVSILVLPILALLMPFLQRYLDNRKEQKKEKTEAIENRKARLTLTLKKLEARVRHIDYELVISNAGPATARNLCVTINDKPVDHYALAKSVDLGEVTLARDATLSIRFSAHQEQTFSITKKLPVDSSRHELPKKGRVTWEDESGTGEYETSF